MLNCVALLLEANNIHPCNDEWLALIFLDALTCEQESLRLRLLTLSPLRLSFHTTDCLIVCLKSRPYMKCFTHYSSLCRQQLFISGQLRLPR